MLFGKLRQFLSRLIICSIWLRFEEDIEGRNCSFLPFAEVEVRNEIFLGSWGGRCYYLIPTLFLDRVNADEDLKASSWCCERNTRNPKYASCSAPQVCDACFILCWCSNYLNTFIVLVFSRCELLIFATSLGGLVEVSKV